MRHPIAAIIGIAVIVVIATGCADRNAPVSPAATATTTNSASTPLATRPISSQDLPAQTPSPAVEPSADPGAGELPTRIVVNGLGIDLPIVSGDLIVPGNPPDYPLCDVAQYLTTYRFPGRPGTTTWIYGHARPGMFLPLLKASTVRSGGALVGIAVDMYSDAAKRYAYRITTVIRHATDRSAATDVPADERRLILQTSEGPSGTVPKLQVVAELVSVASVEPREAIPAASPTVCFIGT